MKREQIKNKFSIAFFITAFAMIFILCMVAGTLYRDVYRKPMLLSHSHSLSDGWSLTRPDESAPQAVNMPMEMSFSGEGDYVLSCTLPEMCDVGTQPVMLFATNHMDIRVFMDGEEIYSHETFGKGMSKTPGNVYHMISLSSDYGGKALQIVLRPLLGSSIVYTVDTPLVAPKGAIINHIFRSDMLSVIIICLILSFGIALFFLAHGLRKISGWPRNLLYISAFAVIFAVYAFCETEVIHLFVSNSYVIYLLDFLTLALLPVPMLMLLKEYAKKSCWKYINIVLSLAFFNFFAQALLNFFNILDLRQMLKATHLIDILSIICVIGFIFFNRDKGHASVKRFGYSMLPIVIGAVLDLVMFYIPGLVTENSFFFQMGVLIFVIVQMRQVIMLYFDMYMKTIRGSIYEKMAYTDALTNIGNRAAFEQKLMQLSVAWAQHMPLWCITADINNLKVINDTYGHSAGDVAISQTARIFSECVANVYRTGGDEFVMFLYNADETQVLDSMEQIHSLLESYNKANDIHLDVALGWDCLRPENDSVLDLYMRADQLMYDEKRKMKEQKLQDI